MRDECSLCGRELPSSSLVRCFRCRKLHCRSCVTYTWYRNVLRYVPLCLNCARRLVSPTKIRRRESKYSPLRRYLARRPEYTKYVTLTFTELEKMIEDKLPSSAFQNRHWWSNADSSTQARSWLYAGWNVRDVNLNDKTVVFQKIKAAKKVTKKKKRSRALAKKTFHPPAPRVPRRKIPSKTKVARAIGRFKNIESGKSSIRHYRGKFKPRSAFEKRLYKPDAKPKKIYRNHRDSEE